MIEDRKSRPLRQTSLVQLAKKGIFIGLEDDAIDQEHGPHSSPHSAVLPTSISTVPHNAAASLQSSPNSTVLPASVLAAHHTAAVSPQSSSHSTFLPTSVSADHSTAAVSPQSSPHSAVLPTSVSAAHHTAAASYTRIKKNTGYLYIKNGHVYKSCGQKAGTKYLKCYNKNCKGTARIKEDQLIEKVISFIFCVFII